MVLQAIILVVAISCDAFVAAFATRAADIKISFKVMLVISFFCAILFAVPVFLGDVISEYVKKDWATAICFALLLCLGLFRLLDSIVKSFVKRRKNYCKELSFSVSGLKFMLKVFANPELADADRSHNLSCKEAVLLALTLSLDNLSLGFGAGLYGMGAIVLFALAFGLGLCGIVFGCFLGKVLAKKSSFELGGLAGILLILLAVLQLI